MADQVFTNTFTHNHGGQCYFITLDPNFATRVTEAATILSRTLPASTDRDSFISNLVQAAQDATPPTPEGLVFNDETQQEEPANAIETPQTLSAKTDVVRRLIKAVQETDNLKTKDDREFEAVSNLLVQLVLAHLSGNNEKEGQDEVDQAVETLVNAYAVTSKPSTAAPSSTARYSALQTLFNALPSSSSSSSKLLVLQRLVAFTAQNDDLAILSPVLANLPTLLSPISVPTSTKDQTVESIVQALVREGAEKEARSVLESYGSKEGRLADVQVLLTLASSEVFDLSPLASLKPSSPFAYLLSVFFSSSSSASLPASLPTLEGFDSVTLDKEQLERKLKLIQLAELCSERVGETVAYEEIATKLGLDSKGGEDGEESGEEVERWVIDAIRASLLHGRLSQPTQSLSIIRALPPSTSSSSSNSGGMEKKHWELVLERLKGWKAGLEKVRGAADRAVGGGNGAVGEVEA
ncbi:hypothetical protein JCM11641_008381 [Rhodosporidiobolus odoratus]